MNPHRVILACLVSAFAVSWFAQSNGLLKMSLAGLGIYLLWVAYGCILIALSWLQDRFESIPGGRRRVIPAFLVPVIAVSWFAGSKTVMWVALAALAYYVIWRVVTAVSNSLYEQRRRRELDDMPLFSLEETTLTMTPHEGAEQKKTLDALDLLLIKTTDQGPFVCDRFLLLAFHDGTVWSVQADNPCYSTFYDAISEALPLDQEQALFAAFSTANGLFTLWERKT